MDTRPLTAADLPRAAALSALVGWSQTPADWGEFLAGGAGRCLDDGDPGSLAATAATLPFGPRLAWISMVVVRPGLRRRGHASVLVRWAMANLREAGVAGLALDATPAGREVYAKLGFRALWGFQRWALPRRLPAEPGVAVRPLIEADWPAVSALDLAAFGAPRGGLLRRFAGRLPPAALVAERRSGRGAPRLAGALLGRDTLERPRLGPLLAADAPTARALLSAARDALPGGAALDLRDGALGLAEWLAAHGAAAERPFTRMALGQDPPGAPALIAAVAGPEFG